MRKAIGIILALMLLMLPASAASDKLVSEGMSLSYKIIIDDQLGLLSDSEVTKLISDMRPISEYGTVVFLTSNGGFGSNDSKALNYLNENVSTSRSFSVVLFHIDMGSRQLTIFSRGAMLDTVTVSEAYSITNNVSRLATKKEYYNCAANAFSQIYQLLRGNKVASQMRVICSVLLAAAIALFSAFKIIDWDKRKYNGRIYQNTVGAASNVLAKLSALNASIAINLDIVEEKLISSKKTERESSSSSCSSCSSSCGGGGSSCSSSCGGGGSSGF